MKRWLDRSVPAQAVLLLLLVAGATKLIRPELSTPHWLVQSVVWTAFAMVFVLIRRRQDRSAMGGASAGEHVSVERKLRRCQIPEDPRERESMRRLVAYRRRQMTRYAWTLVPLFAVLVLLPVVWAVQGVWTTAVLWLLFGLVFGSWVFSARRHNLSRVRHMDEALRAADRVPAGVGRRAHHA
ncbi:hypothetical protein ABZ707_28685 [Streptomyces sp. NPDC006923]|uniref:hypothetical protein n=1 Tax=Streptomyces sp. NPDC006923 TaxID=3155355 RepID=UPI0033CA0B98